jgi:hypothetical protein
MVKITEKILTYIIHANRHIDLFEMIPKLNSEWKVDKITSYPNVCNGEKVIELSNEKGEWLRLPLHIVENYE